MTVSSAPPAGVRSNAARPTLVYTVVSRAVRALRYGALSSVETERRDAHNAAPARQRRSPRAWLWSFLGVALAAASPGCARLEAQAVLTPGVARFARVRAPLVALEHVRVIDGTGAPARDDQTVIIIDGRITRVGPSSQIRAPRGAQRLDLNGHTVIPGLVGLHEHLFYPVADSNNGFKAHPSTFPRLYLAGGVTTARTAGTFDTRADLSVKRDIDLGLVPGPRLLITADYIDGPRLAAPGMASVTTPEQARAFVEYWAAQGVHSIKAYTQIPRLALAEAIRTAHARGLMVTGHLCSVTFREAAEMGIDNLEHGFLVASDWVHDKRDSECPPGQARAFAQLDVRSPEVQTLFRQLVSHRVAITSTLAVAELPAVQQRFRDALAPATLRSYVDWRTRTVGLERVAFDDGRKEATLELAFVRAGGQLVAGADPTGDGQVLPGFGDQRNIELLVEGGFTAVEAIRIATLNGAALLGLDEQIGTISPGKRADLVVLAGNPATRIEDIERVVTVFKDGIGFDAARLLDSVKGRVGID